MAPSRSFGSNHDQSVPLFFVKHTREFSQYVGTSAFIIMPWSTSASSSFLRGSRRAYGTHGGVWITGGTVGSRVM